MYDTLSQFDDDHEEVSLNFTHLSLNNGTQNDENETSINFENIRIYEKDNEYNLKQKTLYGNEEQYGKQRQRTSSKSSKKSSSSKGSKKSSNSKSVSLKSSKASKKGSGGGNDGYIASGQFY